MSSALTFDDILLVPRRSGVVSRKFISLDSFLTNSIVLKNPIVAANMPSVTGPVLAAEISRLGGFAILPRFNTIRDAIAEFYDVKEKGEHCGVSLGVGEDSEARFESLYDAGARIFCVDVAHGHSDRVIEKIGWIKNTQPEVFVIAGNVATLHGAYDLAEAGADTIKVGIGPGAACTTREVTGFGVPQLSAIQEVSQVKEEFPDVKLMADGGIKNSGDIVKALAFGADTVMLGRLLAGAREAPFPGEYFGNASARIRDYRSPEGVSVQIESGVELEDIIKELTWGIRSGLSYAGAYDIFDLQEEPLDYITVTPQSMHETGTRA